MAWTDIEAALRTWLKTGSGFADAAVIFADQDGPKPGRPFLTARIGDATPIGIDAAQEIVRSGSPPAGEEIELRAGGIREFAVVVYAAAATKTGNATARATLLKVQAALALPSVVAAFDAAGISCFDDGRVQNITTVLDSAFESRGLLSCRFYCRETVSEYVGYIATVELEDVAAGTSTVIP